MRGVYCTIVAQNYLPQALALYASVRMREPGRLLVILVIDGVRQDLEVGRPDLRVVSNDVLGLPPREVLDLATIYDVVELSTAVKPLLLKSLLREFEQVVYLDPDTYIVTPLAELEDLVDRHNVVLTPHVLEPIPPGKSFASEVNSLTVGVHNLGFCAVGRGSIPFLDWWWSHLERECLIYPLLGMFVDQKWTDIGAVMFDAYSLRHYGYNVGHWNLHERSIHLVDGSLMLDRVHEPLRLFHFSGFDPKDPEAVSVRQNVSLRDKGLRSAALDDLGREYAGVVLAAQASLGSIPAYGFATDLSGKPLTKRIRRTFRKDLIVGKAGSLPSPFEHRDESSFGAWRTKSAGRQAGGALADAALGFKYAFPDTYSRMKSVMPKRFAWMREMLLGQSKVRR
jgi:hypothetical protein